MPETFPKTPRNKVKRHADRGYYDASIIYPIIDQSLICHVGFVEDQQPFVIPTLHARHGDTILLHGAKGNRLLRHIEHGGSVCISISLLDGIVLARSVFSHSINYRSAVLFGHGTIIEDEVAHVQALERFTERLLPGRWGDARPPSAIELKQTAIAAVNIESASAKIRSGPPNDAEEDLDLPVWAGVLPLDQVAGAPIADSRLRAEIELPAYIANFLKSK